MNVAFGLARYLVGYHFGDVPPPGFGGDDVPLTDDEVAYLCAVQRGLPRVFTRSFIELVSVFMGTMLGRPAEFVAEQLSDPVLCAEISASLLPKQGKTVAVAKPFRVASDGIPVSSNPTWNACIRGTATLADIRSNPDRPSGYGLGCASYHTGTNWRHPDLSVYFTFSRPTKGVGLVLVVPPEYLVVQSDQLVVLK